MAENKGAVLTHSQSVNRLREIQSELERLAELDALTPEDETYFAELREEFEKVDVHRKQLERAADLAFVRSATEGLNGIRLMPGSVQPGRNDYDRDAILEPDSVEDARFRNPWDMSEVRTFGRDPEELGQEYEARAKAAIERMPGASDNVREAAMTILSRADKPTVLAKQILATSSPAYMRAWSKCARGQQHLLTDDEARAMSLTNTAGGYLVPFQLDPAVIITDSGSRNDIRQVARQVVATGNVWNGVSSGAVTWNWTSEASEVADGATTFAGPAITVQKAQGFVPISLEALEDEQNVTQEVARLLAFGKDVLEATAFATGSGSQPQGIVTALVASSPTVIVNSATTDTFAVADVYGLYGNLPARYRSGATWLANNLIYNKIRQFDTAGGASLWTQLGNGRPGDLLGKPVGEAEAMDGVINATQENYSLIFGDFSNYVIADRVGTTVEFIPHLVGTNHRPTGSRGWYAYYRVGADSVNDGAFRLLDIT